VQNFVQEARKHGVFIDEYSELTLVNPELALALKSIIDKK
jgi:hypothetical protein